MSKISAYTANTTPATTDLFVMVDDPAGSPLTQKITMADHLKVINGLTADTTPDVTADYIPVYDASASAAKKVLLKNLTANTYKITPSVATNNLTIAITHADGSAPTSTRPLLFLINGQWRAATGTLSLTKNAGTNWFNSGATAHATFAQDYFVYVSWRAASSAVVVGFARIPYARLYSDFSATTTAEKHGAFDTAPASTDDVAVIGRFQATLSATAAFNWSVPTFTSSNLIQQPIYESEFMTWAPSPTGFSSVPTATLYQYRFVGKDIVMRYREGTNGTSNATSFGGTAPFTALTITNGNWNAQTNGVDNGTVLTAPSAITITSGVNTLTMLKDLAAAAWTNVNGKRIGYAELRYPVAS